MSEALLTLEGVHTHIAQYHILQGVSFAVPEGGITVLLGAQRRRQDHLPAHHHGAVARLAGPHRVRRREHRRRSTRRPSRGAASPTCRRTWGCSPT